jgi:hypothetical protein
MFKYKNGIPEAEFEEVMADYESHSKCLEYKCLKEEWEKVIEEGSTRCCPSCGIGGIKDGECTHIT